MQSLSYGSTLGAHAGVCVRVPSCHVCMCRSERSTLRPLAVRREGCNIEGTLLVNKVAGNFHFALTKADHHVLMTVFKQREAVNVSHVIHTISFGEVYPEMVNPLDHTPKIVYQGSGYFQYHIKVVPTLYEPWYGKPLQTNQYSYTELFRTTHELDKFPAVFFHYEFSPIMARFSQSRRSYSSFLTGLCAIVGGVFTVAGMVDSCLHRIKILAGARQ